MDFLQFVRACGIVIDRCPPVGRWVRLPTDDKPNHKNGAVKFLGYVGYAQNHATQTEVSIWHKEGTTDEDVAEQQKIANQAHAEIEAKQKRAAEKAEWILSQCELETHQYLVSKGFPQERANVWTTEDGKRLLVIPMRVGRQIVGCQLIGEDGTKKFLTGQRTSDAAFVIDNRGLPVLCEGYATALSVRAALAALKARYAIFVCFSAHNVGRLAKELPRGLIVADNDASGTGERVAKETGWPYFMPPDVGMDFNDWHQSTSLFKCSQALRSALLAS
jgi:putative DNA primase/helicase